MSADLRRAISLAETTRNAAVLHALRTILADADADWVHDAHGAIPVATPRLSLLVRHSCEAERVSRNLSLWKRRSTCDVEASLSENDTARDLVQILDGRRRCNTASCSRARSRASSPPAPK